MSKSKGNTVDPQSLIEQYGADTLRLFIIFTSPPEQSLEWSDTGVEGAHRYLRRLWNFCYQHKKIIHDINLRDRIHLVWKTQLPSLQKVRRELYQILQQANQDMEKQQFNTVVSACMKLLNLLYDLSPVVAQFEKTDENAYFAGKQLITKGLSVILRLLYPVTPHITDYLWTELKYEHSIHKIHWPRVSKEALIIDELDIVIQVNGKLRGQLQISVSTDNANIEKAALAHPTIAKLIEGKVIKKVIYVPKKLINIVVGE
jgi:leucyl-tRNA synthetase